MLNIKIDSQDLARAQNLLSGIQGGYKRAVNAALRRTLQQMKTQVSRLTHEKYYLKAGEVNKTLSVSVAGMTGRVTSRGKKLSISEYYISPKTRIRNMQGIRAAVKRDGIKFINKAFLIKLGSGGKYYPYVRTGKSRWDIRRIMSPAVPQAMGNPEIISELEDFTEEKFSERLNHEVMRQLGVFSK